MSIFLFFKKQYIIEMKEALHEEDEYRRTLSNTML